MGVDRMMSIQMMLQTANVTQVSQQSSYVELYTETLPENVTQMIHMEKLPVGHISSLLSIPFKHVAVNTS
jgi:hypothetical protein